MDSLIRRPVQFARQQLFHIALLATLILVTSGCAAFRGLGASPEPTTTPTPTDTPTATPTPTSTAPPTQDARIDHPTGATDVILRMEWGGGLMPMEFFVTQAPQFTLYGDGTAVFQPLPDPNGVTFGEPKPPFLTGQMTEEVMQELLDYALNDGGLANAKTSYDYPMIADASTTNFVVHAGGLSKAVSVYALMEGTESGPDQADRNALGKLQQRLSSFETEARNGAVDAVTDYDPAAYRAVMFDQATQGPAPDVVPIDWPWPDIQPSSFEATDGRGTTRILSRDETAKLTDVPNGGQLSIWVKAPDKSLVGLAVRPLLPDELEIASPGMWPR